jgi:hypothetical protein
MNLLSALPDITRARGYRLYTRQGKRFIDFWQDGGRSILGVRQAGFTLVVKDRLSAGLYRDLPSAWGRQFPRLASLKFPGWATSRVFASEERALRALELHAGLGSGSLRSAFDLPDPAKGEAAKNGLSLLRPFLPLPEAEACLALLPLPPPLSPGLLLFARDPGQSVESDIVSPLQLAAAAKALSDLEYRKKDFAEAQWRLADPFIRGLFARRGPYLLPECGEGDYPSLFKELLDSGVLISPEHGVPSVLPFEWDEGELKPLRSAARPR